MPKSTSTYICQQCGYHSPTYLGRCPQCDNWNSFVETIERAGSSQSSVVRQAKIELVNLKDVQKSNYQRLSTGISELDRVLGGGIVAGSLILVSGDPGIGKSTLLTQLALNLSVIPAKAGIQLKNSDSELDPRLRGDDKGTTLYVAGEESPQQIKIRADRIKPGANLIVLNETDVDIIVAAIEQFKPSLVIIDSVQTIQTQDLNSVAGSISQVRESTNRLQKIAKRLHVPIFLIGHVTKEGTVAGPKTLEHVVDVVLSLEGDPNNNLRILRGNKNRFGSTDEVGIFEMEEKGMIEVLNPSKLFLDQKVNAPGSVVSVILTGLRPLLIEIQALVTKTNLPIPRRTAAGIDNNRLQLLVAVLQKRLGLKLFDQDIFVNVVGGLKVLEPAADLAVALAIISSYQEKSVKEKTVFIGEVGLLGEIREIRNLEKRINEAKKLGFISVISFKEARNLAEAVKLGIAS